MRNTLGQGINSTKNRNKIFSITTSGTGDSVKYVLEIPYKVIKSEISISIERIAKTYNEQLKKIEALKIEMNQAHQNDELIKKLEAFEALSPLPELTEKTEAEYYRKKLERMYLMGEILQIRENHQQLKKNNTTPISA